MNVYDFDNTIYTPDSSFSFILYCFREHPLPVIKAIGLLICNYLKGSVKSTEDLKNNLFSFLKEVRDIDEVTEQFWKKKISGIQDWYLSRQRPDDVIVSASPSFLIEPVARRLGFRLIATEMNKKTGIIAGKNCHDVEKVRRFKEEFPNANIEDFFSDSKSDTPMAELALNAYLVSGNRIEKWPGH